MKDKWIILIFVIFFSTVNSLYLFNKEDNIIQITSENYKLLLPEGLWLVEFYTDSCEHCKLFVPDIKKLATLTKDVISVGAINMGENAKRFISGVTEFPTVKMFHKGKDLGTYLGNRRAEEIFSWGLKVYEESVLAASRSKADKNVNNGIYSHDETDNVIRLFGSSFHESIKEGIWLVEFYAPWCGHCKTLKGEWIRLAQSTKGNYNVAALNMVDDIETAILGINAYPTICLYYNGIKLADYKDGRTAERILEFTIKTVEKYLIDSMTNTNPDVINLSLKESEKVKFDLEEEAGKGKKEDIPDNKLQDAESEQLNISLYSNDNVVELTDSNFNSLVIESNDVWVVTFGFKICNPCRKQESLISEAISSYEVSDLVKAGSVNINENQMLKEKYSEEIFPYSKIFIKGIEHSTYASFNSKEQIIGFLIKLLEENKISTKIFELNDDKQINNIRHRPGATVLVFLPIADSIEENDETMDNGLTYLQEYEKIVNYQKRGLPIQYYWVKAHKFPKLQMQFSLYNFPIVVVINYEKKFFGVMKKSFLSENVISFISEIVEGKQTLKKFDELNFN